VTAEVVLAQVSDSARVMHLREYLDDVARSRFRVIDRIDPFTAVIRQAAPVPQWSSGQGWFAMGGCLFWFILITLWLVVVAVRLLWFAAQLIQYNLRPWLGPPVRVHVNVNGIIETAVLHPNELNNDHD
jgi:hypothetical protein